MVELMILVAFVALVLGIGLGWYLRRINVWCPHCGDALTCPGCGGRPAWSALGRARRSAR
jgi:hypothetical protein